jgi:hypothetical protein
VTEFYPGSKTPVGVLSTPPGALPIDEWLDQLAEEQRPPLVYSLDGKDVQFFERGALAMVLGRKPGTLRLWEQQGRLPEPQFRKERAADKHDRQGIRYLWTRDQVRGIYQIALDEGLLSGESVFITRTRFTERVVELFKLTGKVVIRG